MSTTDHLAQFDRQATEIAEWRRLEPKVLPGIQSLSDYRKATTVGVMRGYSHLFLTAQHNPAPATLRETHRLMFAQATTEAGQFRQAGQVGAQIAEPGRIPIEMRRLSAETDELFAHAADPQDLCAALAFYHARFLGIQPFAEGSDQIGRLVLESQANLQGLRFNMGELLANQSAYKEALTQARTTNDLTALTQLIGKSVNVEIPQHRQFPAPYMVRPRPMLHLADVQTLALEREMARVPIAAPSTLTQDQRKAAAVADMRSAGRAYAGDLLFSHYEFTDGEAATVALNAQDEPVRVVWPPEGQRFAYAMTAWVKQGGVRPEPVAASKPQRPVAQVEGQQLTHSR